MRATRRTREKPASLREIAALLGISRKKLMRLIREGIPIERAGDGYLRPDPAVIQSWIDEHDAPVKLAPVLHPDDPRHRERSAAATITAIKSGLARGDMIPTSDVLARCNVELAEFRARLMALDRLGIDASGAGAATVERELSAAILDVLAVLKADSADTWPIPRPAPDDDSWLDAPDDRDVLPLLAPGDPRFDFARSRADQRELELTDLQEAVVPLADALACLRAEYAAIRKRVREIPALVAWDLDDESNPPDRIRDAIEDAVYLALCDLSGTVPDPDRPLSRSDVDDMPVDDVDDHSTMRDSGRQPLASKATPPPRLQRA